MGSAPCGHQGRHQLLEKYGREEDADLVAGCQQQFQPDMVALLGTTDDANAFGDNRDRLAICTGRTACLSS